MSIESGFWLSLGILAYVYVGYPVVVFALAALLDRSVAKGDFVPTVSVVIAAYNEADEIVGTVENKLSQDYPPAKLDVTVVSDGSTDSTDERILALVDATGGRLRLLRQEPRQGKTQALNLALQRVAGEVVVFADANSRYSPDAVRALARNFADPDVGYVTGQMVYTNSGGSAVGEGNVRYMSYENLLRSAETRIGSVVGVDGGIDAVRRDLFVPMRADQLPDFVLPLNVVDQGRRVVYEPKAKLHEAALATPADEFRMRVRVTLRALWAIHDMRNLLNPFRAPLFAWQLISHKVLRYLAFLPLIGLLIFNLLALGRHPFYLWFLVAQLAAYVAAAAGHMMRESLDKKSVLLTPYYSRSSIWPVCPQHGNSSGVRR